MDLHPMRMSEKQVNVLVGGALLALLPLAWLQYRWISEVAEADQQRAAHQNVHLLFTHAHGVQVDCPPERGTPVRDTCPI